jgi:hypothetical protein
MLKAKRQRKKLYGVEEPPHVKQLTLNHCVKIGLNIVLTKSFAESTTGSDQIVFVVQPDIFHYG